MGDYYDIYKLRLNRFGDNYQNRLQGMREKNFSNYSALISHKKAPWINHGANLSQTNLVSNHILN